MRSSRLLAMLTMAGLVTALSVALGSGREEAEDVGPRPTQVTSESSHRPASGQTKPSLSVTSSSATSSTLDPKSDPLEVVGEGLEAWGRFGVSKDLADVAGWFHPRGPQFERFEIEASEEPLGGPPYVVDFQPGDTESLGDEMRVSARVVFVRTGEPSQSFDWVIVLRRDDQRWSIWTVEETDRQTG